MAFGIPAIAGLASGLLSQLSIRNVNSSPPQPPANPFDNPNGPFANLNLTTAQTAQIDQILSNAKSQGLSASQVNSQISQVLSPAQQQTFQSDLQQLQSHHGHHHHHGGGSSNSQSLLSQLGLSSDQQNQINQLVQGSQSNGTSPSALLTQIDNVLSSSQQTQLATLLSTGTYTAGGAASTGNQPYLLNTSA